MASNDSIENETFINASLYYSMPMDKDGVRDCKPYILITEFRVSKLFFSIQFIRLFITDMIIFIYDHNLLLSNTKTLPKTCKRKHLLCRAWQKNELFLKGISSVEMVGRWFCNGHRRFIGFGGQFHVFGGVNSSQDSRDFFQPAFVGHVHCRQSFHFLQHYILSSGAGLEKW